MFTRISSLIAIIFQHHRQKFPLNYTFLKKKFKPFFYFFLINVITIDFRMQ